MGRGAVMIVGVLLLSACGDRQSGAGASGSARGSGPAAATSSSGSAGPVATGSAGLPSPGSADVVSRASEPYAGPPVLAEGKLDGAALRAHNKARLARDDSAVIALEGGSAVELGKKICEAVVPKRPASTPVLVKPNIGGFDSIKSPDRSDGDDGVKGRVSNPEFVRGVIQCLKERGHKSITIADGWGAPHRYWEKLIDVSGYAAMARSEGVPLVCMCDDGVFDLAPGTPGKPVAVGGMEQTKVSTLLLPKILAEHLNGGLFIEVPKLKTHRFSVVSLGIKNLQGVVMSSVASPAHAQKWRMHAELNDYLKSKSGGAEDRRAYVDSLDRFATRMVDVLEVAAPDAVLLDGTPAMQGDGFQKMVPMREQVAIGGTNAVRVDQVGSMFLGAWKNPKLAAGLGGHDSSPLVEQAGKRFGIDFTTTKIEGSAKTLFAKPRPLVFKAIAPFEVHESASATGAAEPAVPSDKKLAHAADAGSDALAMDGVLDEPAWARATPIEFDTSWRGDATGAKTKVRLLWQRGALFAGFEVEGTGLLADASFPKDRDRPKLYEEDCVELFIGAGPSEPKHYFEIEVGPLGHFLDLEVDKAAKTENVAWSSGLSVGTRPDASGRRAVIELKLTAPEIRAHLERGVILPFALYRMEGKSPRQYLAWSPTMTDRPNFHVPDRFGAIVLD